MLVAVAAAISYAASHSPARAAAPGRAAATPARVFDPVAFFSGRTEGAGILDEAMSSPKTTRASSVGSVRAGGLLVIDQTVEVEGEPTRQRQWQLRQTAPGRFSGTLSDAKGPVTGVIAGNRMQIAYTMKEGGMKVDQVLTLAADGRSVTNNMKIRKFGIVVAKVAETIRKL